MVGRILFGLLAGPSLVAGLVALLAPGVAAAETIAIDAVPVPLVDPLAAALGQDRPGAGLQGGDGLSE